MSQLQPQPRQASVMLSPVEIALLRDLARLRLQEIRHHGGKGGPWPGLVDKLAALCPPKG